MGLMKSLFGNRGAQQVAENKLVITEVGPNPAQVIAIAQNYFPEDPTGIATVLNDNILEGQSTIITLPETESLYEMQQALDNAGASTYIQKNWQDEEDAPALANIVIYSIGEQKDAVIECYHNILGFDRRDLELKLLTGVSDDNGFFVSTTKERAETLKEVLDELGADTELEVTWDIEAEASLIVLSTGRMDKYDFCVACNMGYKTKLMTKEITYDNYKDISEDAPVILDGICEELLLAKKNIELFGGEAFIVFDTDESVGAALLIMDAGASGADTLKVMLNYLDVNMAEANAQVNELAMGKSQLIKGSLGLLKRMKKQLDAVHVTSELMLDMDEDETEEEAYDDTYEKSAAGLHCMNCRAEIASGSKFCPKCGTKVEEAQKMFCSQCGNEIMPGAKFCTKCGARCM